MKTGDYQVSAESLDFSMVEGKNYFGEKYAFLTKNCIPVERRIELTKYEDFPFGLSEKDIETEDELKLDDWADWHFMTLAEVETNANHLDSNGHLLTDSKEWLLEYLTLQDEHPELFEDDDDEDESWTTYDVENEDGSYEEPEEDDRPYSEVVKEWDEETWLNEFVVELSEAIQRSVEKLFRDLWREKNAAFVEEFGVGDAELDDTFFDKIDARTVKAVDAIDKELKQFRGKPEVLAELRQMQKEWEEKGEHEVAKVIGISISNGGCDPKVLRKGLEDEEHRKWLIKNFGKA